MIVLHRATNEIDSAPESQLIIHLYCLFYSFPRQRSTFWAPLRDCIASYQILVQLRERLSVSLMWYAALIIFSSKFAVHSL